MDKIYSTKPSDKLELADREIKTYVTFLEKELQHWLTMKTINQCLEAKLLNTESELKLLKLQTKDNNQNDKLQEEINKLKKQNSNLMIENVKTKQAVSLLQNGVQQRKSADEAIKILSSTSNANTIHTTSSVSITDKDDPNANSVLVKGITENQLNGCSKINIINLARLMNIKIFNRDIIKVTKKERKYYERHNLKPSKTILIVQFRTPDIKVEFLKNKDKLRYHLKAEDIEISDYVSDEVYNLYQYAKILKNYGFAQIYWRNNAVYAKMTPSTHCDPVLILTKNDVDVLKASTK